MLNCIDWVLLQYADDSALIVPDKDPIRIGQRTAQQKPVSQCNKWFVDNKLSLHMGKTELILFEHKLSKWKGYTIGVKGKQSMLLLM